MDGRLTAGLRGSTRRRSRRKQYSFARRHYPGVGRKLRCWRHTWMRRCWWKKDSIWSRPFIRNSREGDRIHKHFLEKVKQSA